MNSVDAEQVGQVNYDSDGGQFILLLALFVYFGADQRSERKKVLLAQIISASLVGNSHPQEEKRAEREDSHRLLELKLHSKSCTN